MQKKINLKKIFISIIAIITLLTSMGNSFINVYAEGEETSAENSDSSSDVNTSETTSGGAEEGTLVEKSDLDPVSEWSNTESDANNEDTEVETISETEAKETNTLIMPDTGSTVNLSKEAWLTVLPNGSDTEIIQRDIYKTKEEAKASVGAVKVDDGTTDYEMYAWDNDGTVIWWSDAEYVYLPVDSSELFANHPNLKEFDFTYFKMDNVREWYNIFQGCLKLDVTMKDTNFEYSGYKIKNTDLSTSLEINNLTLENCKINSPYFWFYMVENSSDKNGRSTTLNTLKIKKCTIPIFSDYVGVSYSSGIKNIIIEDINDGTSKVLISSSAAFDSVTIKNCTQIDVATIYAKNIKIVNCKTSNNLNVHPVGGDLEILNSEFKEIFLTSSTTDKIKNFCFDNSKTSTLDFNNVYVLGNFYARNATIGKMSKLRSDSAQGIFDISGSTITLDGGQSYINFQKVICRNSKLAIKSMHFQMGEPVQIADFYNTTFASVSSNTIYFYNFFSRTVKLQKVNFEKAHFAENIQTIYFSTMFLGCNFDNTIIDLSPLFENSKEYSAIYFDSFIGCTGKLRYLGLNGVKANSVKNFYINGSVSIDLLEMKNCNLNFISTNNTTIKIGVLDLSGSTMQSSNYWYFLSVNATILEGTTINDMFEILINRGGSTYEGCEKLYVTNYIDMNGATISSTEIFYPAFSTSSNEKIDILDLTNVKIQKSIFPTSGKCLIRANYLKLPNPENISSYEYMIYSPKKIDGLYVGQLDLSNQSISSTALKSYSANYTAKDFWSSFQSYMNIESVVTTAELGVPTWYDKWYMRTTSGDVVSVSYGDTVANGTVLYKSESDAKANKTYSLSSETQKQRMKDVYSFIDSVRYDINTQVQTFNGSYLNEAKEESSELYTLKLVTTKNGQSIKNILNGSATLQVYDEEQNVVATAGAETSLYLNTEKNYTATVLSYPNKDGMKTTITSSQDNVNHVITVYIDYSEYTSVTANKIWNDGGLVSERTEYVTAMLYRNGEVIKSQKLSDDNNWTYTWEGLTKSEATNGSVIQNEYTVKEIVPDGYKVSYEETVTGKEYASNDSTNKQNFNVDINWNTSSELFSKVASIHLYANEIEVDSELVQMYCDDGSKAGKTTITFYDKPIIDENGNYINYSVKEDDIENCSSSVSSISTSSGKKFIVNNTFNYPQNSSSNETYTTIDLLVRKIWTGDYVKDGKLVIDKSVGISTSVGSKTIYSSNAKKLNDTAYYNDVVFTEKINTKSTILSSAISELTSSLSESTERYNSDGYLNFMEIKEKGPLYREIINTGYEIANDETNTISVTKTYEGEDVENHPEQITLYALTNNGTITLGTMQTPNIENNKATFEVPKYYYNGSNKIPYVIKGVTENTDVLSEWRLKTTASYSESADATFGFDTFDLVNERKLFKKIKIRKKWEGDNAENQYQKLTITLKGSYTNSNNEKKAFSYPFVWDLGEDTQISETEFESEFVVPSYAYDDNGKYPIKYEDVEEAKSNIYTLIDKQMSLTEDALEENGYDFFVLTNKVKTTTYTVNKVWNTPEESEKLDSVTVQLCSGSTVKDEQVLSDENNWTYTWENLPNIEYYTIKEVVLEGYKVQRNQSWYKDENDATHSFDITTFINTPLRTITISSQFDDLNNKFKKRGSYVEVGIYEGYRIEKSVRIPSSSENYTASVEVPKYNSSGNLIEYTVKSRYDSASNYYTFTVEKDENSDTYQVTYYYRPPTYAKISIAKYWKDSDETKRPETVEFKVYANDVYTGRTITVSAENGWAASDTEHFYYLDDNDEEINYTLEEVEVDGYTSKISRTKYSDEDNRFYCTNTVKQSVIPETTASSKLNLWSQIVNIINSTKNSISISKQVSGDMANPDEYFEFNVNVNNGEPNGEITVNLTSATITTDEFTNPLTYTLDENGEGSFSVYLKHGETITLEEIRRHTNVTVTEVNNPYSVVSELNYKGTTTSGSESVSISDMYDDATITYMNAVPDGKNLVISKTVEGNMGNKSKEFQFAVQLPEQYANQKVLYAKTGDEVLHIGSVDENAKFSFSLMHEEQIKIVGISEGDALEIASKENYGVVENDYNLEGYSTTYECNTDENNNLTVSVTNTRASGVPTGNHVSTGVMATFGIVLIGLAFVLRKKIFKS